MEPIEVQGALAAAVEEVLETMCFTGVVSSSESALAETGGAVSYTVQPGDSLWSIAERVSPTSDPRPLVARMASELGSETVVPGERITVP